MNELFSYWRADHKNDGEKINIKVIISAGIVIGVALFLVALGLVNGFSGIARRIKEMKPKADVPLTEDVHFPEYTFRPDIFLKLENAVSSSTSARVKILSASAYGLYEQDKNKSRISTSSATPSVHLSGLRVLGEMENVGTETVTKVIPIARFLDNHEKFISTRIANFNQNYTFIPMKTNSVIAFDVLISKPATSSSINIEMRPMEDDKNQKLYDTSSLKIKDKSYEVQRVNKSGQTFRVFKFSTVIINTAGHDVSDPTVYVWFKDDKNSVFAIGEKVYENEILTAGQEMPVNMLVVPLRESTVFTYEVRAFGKPLTK